MRPADDIGSGKTTTDAAGREGGVPIEREMRGTFQGAGTTTTGRGAHRTVHRVGTTMVVNDGTRMAVRCWRRMLLQPVSVFAFQEPDHLTRIHLKFALEDAGFAVTEKADTIALASTDISGACPDKGAARDDVPTDA